MRFVQNEHRMLLAGFMQAHDGFRDLVGEIAADVRGFQIQTASDLP